MSAPKTDFTMEEVRDFIDNELPTYLDQQQMDDFLKKDEADQIEFAKGFMGCILAKKEYDEQKEGGEHGGGGTDGPIEDGPIDRNHIKGGQPVGQGPRRKPSPDDMEGFGDDFDDDDLDMDKDNQDGQGGEPDDIDDDFEDDDLDMGSDGGKDGKGGENGQDLMDNHGLEQWDAKSKDESNRLSKTVEVPEVPNITLDDSDAETQITGSLDGDMQDVEKKNKIMKQIAQELNLDDQFSGMSRTDIENKMCEEVIQGLKANGGKMTGAGRGSALSSLQKINAITKEVVDWKEILSDFVNTTSFDSMEATQHMSRTRIASHDLGQYMRVKSKYDTPRRDKICDVLFFVDNSGSMYTTLGKVSLFDLLFGQLLQMTENASRCGLLYYGTQVDVNKIRLWGKDPNINNLRPEYSRDLWDACSEKFDMDTKEGLLAYISQNHDKGGGTSLASSLYQLENQDDDGYSYYSIDETAVLIIITDGDDDCFYSGSSLSDAIDRLGIDLERVIVFVMNDNNETREQVKNTLVNVVNMPVSNVVCVGGSDFI